MTGSDWETEERDNWEIEFPAFSLQSEKILEEGGGDAKLTKSNLVQGVKCWVTLGNLVRFRCRKDVLELKKFESKQKT